MSDENLKNLIDKFESIGSSINTISSSLKNILTNKNVKTSEVDKLSDLVSKVDKLNPQELGVRINKLDENPDTCVSYVGDAIGMTPASVGSYGSWDTIDFIRDIKPCGFKDGIVTKYIKKENFNMYEDGTNVEDDTDVMIEFPKFYWKIQSSDNYMDIFISKTKLDDDYECPAHLIGSTEKEFIYIGAYLASLENNNLRSKKNGSPEVRARGQFYSLIYKHVPGYDSLDYQCVLMLQILFVVMFKSINFFSLGVGYSSYISGHGKSNKINTGGSNFKGMIYGEQNGDEQMKFLGIEDLWGNCLQEVSRCTCGVENACIYIRIITRNKRNIQYGVGRKVGTISDVIGGNNTGFMVKQCLIGGGSNQDSRYYRCWASLAENRIGYYTGFDYSESSRLYGLFSSYFQTEVEKASTRLIFIGEDNRNTLKTIQEDELLLVENKKVGGLL
ncbi:hypothetical protein CDFC105_70043 [Clostridioides difficile]|nr:hypothetical protein CDFC105_64575 [Clostridioides difficile]CZR99825.1 hypothetical protein CDFC105_70043 [Clostridioides difficile]